MARNNRFRRDLAELSPREREAIEAVVPAVATTFREVAERQGSEYYAAAGLTPVETWVRVAEELAKVSVLAALAGARDEAISVEDIADLHEAIFAPVFGPQIAGFRGEGDSVQFPVTRGTRDAPVPRSMLGATPKSIQAKLTRAVSDFERVADRLGERVQAGEPIILREAALPVVILYARVIRIHPFIDGNGRTAWACFVFALRRCGLPIVVARPTPQTRWALGAAIRADSRHSFEPLADIVVDTIRSSAAEGVHN